MSNLIRRIPFSSAPSERRDDWLTREWLITNGLGGYASGTISGIATRRYHGLLISAHAAPLGRRLLFSHLSERLRLADGRVVKLSGEAYEPGDLHLYGSDHLAEFRLEMGMPVWRYELEGVTIERQLVMPHEQNTVFIIYRLLDGPGPVRLKLLPTVHNRGHDDPVSTPLPDTFRLTENGGRYELSVAENLPTLRMMMHGSDQAFTVQRQTLPERLYEIEKNRGYESHGTLWSPGYFRIDLSADAPAALVASTESWDVVGALHPAEAILAEQARAERLLAAAAAEARSGPAAELVLAADQFIIRPVGRAEDAARLHAQGDEIRTVIAGYHWFTDWGRDTMISLEGLTLTTGREAEAAYILRTFGYFVRDGLLPNLFPEGATEGLYHTADATMWFFHAIDRYVERTGDRAMIERLMPTLLDIIDHHLRGTRFGIGVDPHDHLLRQGAPGYQLTWMDAKVGDWVVTPRRGKAVEINALWYNALRLAADWSLEFAQPGDVQRLNDEAEKMRASFNRRFWYAEGGYLYDVVDAERGGDDAACRPNQVLAIAPRYAVLDSQHWASVMRVVAERLVTPVGLRSLAPGHPDYRERYDGDLRSRDAAYHQGTVWAWLIGPFIDAWLKVHPEDVDGAARLLEGFNYHYGEACVGSISEIFDAEAPFTPRGCVAQAWSVAEVLRCLVKVARCRPSRTGEPAESAALSSAAASR